MSVHNTREPCAAHNCLKPRWKDGWCAAHWHAHLARMQQQRATLETVEFGDSLPEFGDSLSEFGDSLWICEAIWNAS